MKKNTLTKNIIIILSSNILIRILYMINKIMYTKTLGLKIISTYTLITPTLIFIYSISSFGFIISISKIIAKNKYKKSDILKNAYIINIFSSTIIILIIIILSLFINKMLHYNNLNYIVLTNIFIVPLIGISSIQKGFFYGMENMMIPSIFSCLEEIIKIILISLILPLIVLKGDVISIITLLSFNFITETISIIFLNKIIRKKINETKGSINYEIIKEILKTSIFIVLISFSSTIFEFLEPIIYTNVMIKIGYHINAITKFYAIINSYILPILLLPSFFTLSISSALLPNLTKDFNNNHHLLYKKKVFNTFIISLIYSIISITIILVFSKEILFFLYNKCTGINYLYILAPIFIFVYLESILIVGVQSKERINKLLYITLISNIIKYIFLIIGSKYFGKNAFIYALMIQIVTSFFLTFYVYIKKSN